MPRSLARDFERLRARIDAEDDAIVDRLARRRRAVLALSEVKRDLGLKIFDPAREASLLARLRSRGAARGLDARFVAALFRLVLKNSKAVQRREAAGRA